MLFYQLPAVMYPRDSVLHKFHILHIFLYQYCESFWTPHFFISQNSLCVGAAVHPSLYIRLYYVFAIARYAARSAALFPSNGSPFGPQWAKYSPIPSPGCERLSEAISADWYGFAADSWDWTALAYQHATRTTAGTSCADTGFYVFSDWSQASPLWETTGSIKGN